MRNTTLFSLSARVSLFPFFSHFRNTYAMICFYDKVVRAERTVLSCAFAETGEDI